MELILNEDYRYIRALGVLYFRMTCQNPVLIYETLEPLLADYRRLAVKTASGQFEVLHMDEYIETLLTSDMLWGV
jgi:pre-mRNA-splicing factor 38A